MGALNYISVIERYHEYADAIHELMASIVTGITDGKLLGDESAQREVMQSLSELYPFFSLLYILDADGIQSSDLLAWKNKGLKTIPAKGSDRSQRPYYLLASTSEGVAVTEPYLSTIGGGLCLSAALRCKGEDGQTAGYLVVDIDLAGIIEFLRGERSRMRFEPLFKGVYLVIGVGLMAVVAALLIMAFREIFLLFFSQAPYKLASTPFGVIIFLTLALAIFDLGKTIIEEEILLHKDIFHHSSTRRTITRFVAAILIAVSIESLLLMFKSALGKGAYMTPAVWMMMAAVALMVGLGIFVYLSAKAEAIFARKVFPQRRSSKQMGAEGKRG